MNSLFDLGCPSWKGEIVNQRVHFLCRRTKRRTRAVGQPCISPDSYLFKVSCAQNGVSCLAFSPNGKYLAAACAEYAMFPIKVSKCIDITWYFSMAIWNVCLILRSCSA
jgi:hypothetical protein